MLLVAGAASGDAEALLELARSLYGRRSTVFSASSDCSRTICTGCTLKPEHLVQPGARAVLVCSGAWASTFTTLFYKSGEPLAIGACVEYRLGREALLTGNPPAPARRNPEAILYSYISRLVADGAPLERIAGKLAARAGAGAAALLAVRLGAGGRCRPEAYIAVHGSKKLCILHRGASAAAAAPYTAEVGGLDCRRSVLARIYNVASVVRVEVKSLDRILYT
jgi:hypothetical protein